MTDREDFELWANSKGISLDWSIGSGDYILPDTRLRWIIWQEVALQAEHLAERQAAQPDTDDLGIAYSLGRADEREAKGS